VRFVPTVPRTIDVPPAMRPALVAVISDQAEEAHLHGYDLSRDIGQGKVGRYRFKADIDGIFELELENAGVQIAELRVEP